jgi:multiple sugar transport system substrate-binding protein
MIKTWFAKIQVSNEKRTKNNVETKKPKKVSQQGICVLAFGVKLIVSRHYGGNMRRQIRLRVHAFLALLGMPCAFFSISNVSAQTVTLATHYPPENVAVLEPCFAQYQQETSVEIVHQQIPYGDYLQTILTARLGGQAPDIYHVYSIWAAQLVDNGLLAPPPNDILGFVEENYVPSTVNAVTIDDQVWGVPTEVSNYLLVYNKNIFAEAGITAPPKTWDELLEIAAATTKRDAQGRATQIGYADYYPSVAGVVHRFLTHLYSKGVDLFSEDFTETNLNSPEALEALQERVELFRAGSADLNVDSDAFDSGDVAMTIQASWQEGTFREVFGDAFEETVGVSAIPNGDNWRSLQYAFFYGVDANSDVQNEAWAFIEWLNSQASAQQEGGPSCMGEMLVDLGALTANEGDVGAAQDELGDFFTAPFADALERSITEPNVIQASEIETILQTYLLQAYRGDLEPEAALTQADEEITAILAEFY